MTFVCLCWHVQYLLIMTDAGAKGSLLASKSLPPFLFTDVALHPVQGAAPREEEGQDDSLPSWQWTHGCSSYSAPHPHPHRRSHHNLLKHPLRVIELQAPWSILWLQVLWRYSLA